MNDKLKNVEYLHVDYELILLNLDDPKTRIDPHILFNILKSSGFRYMDDFEQFLSGDSILNGVVAKIRTGKVRSLLEGRNEIRDYVKIKMAIESWHYREPIVDKTIRIAFRLKKRMGLEVYDPKLKIFLDEKNMPKFNRNLEMSYKRTIKRDMAIAEQMKNYKESQSNLTTLPAAKTSVNFESKCKISITGETIFEKNNIVLIDQIRVLLTDKPLALFLRLIQELNKGGEGYVYKIDLTQEGYLSKKGSDQGISRLKQQIRYPMEAGSKMFNIDQFIEKKPKQIRLSNPPEMIDINIPRLLQHPDPAIVKLAQQFQ